MNDRARTGFSDAQAAAIVDGLRRRETTRDPEALRGLDRIEIRVAGALAYEARNPHEPEGLMHIGEPEDRGGTGTGNSPLSHFLTGAAACLLNQLVRVAVADDLPISFRGVRARGAFRRDPGGAYERIVYEVDATGSIDDPAAAALAERADRLCYVSNTLARAVELTTILVVDGREMARIVRRPA
jgi:uncharacterized OsmC-like protein